MKELSEYSKKELENELARRKNILPSVKNKIDWSKVIDNMKDIVTSVIEDDCAPKDFEYYLFHECAKAIYGDDFFDWWNSHNS